MDTLKNFYVADTFNNRVLECSAPLSSGMAASRVFGQDGSFTSNTANIDGVAPTSLGLPLGVAVDAAGNLFIADYKNHRVLEYNTPLTSDTTADNVYGQTNRFTASSYTGQVNANSLAGPKSLAVDAQDDLFVSDFDNSRVVEYKSALTTDATGDLVLGEPTFAVTNSAQSGVNASVLAGPAGLALDPKGNLFVADTFDNRTLEYSAPLTSGMAAGLVFGQPDMFSHGVNTGGVSRASLALPFGAALDARGDLFVVDTLNSRVLEYDYPLLLQLYLPLVRR